LKSFQQAVRSSSFTVTGQLRLHQDSRREDIIRQAETLAPVVDAVAVTDCPYGVLHMSGLAVSAILLERGIDPLMHLSARDRNRMALKSELLGAAGIGVTSLLLQRGEKIPSDEKPGLTHVNDTGAKKFLRIARQLSDFQLAHGDPPLFLGTMATVFDPDDDWTPGELRAKAEAGADFVQTQICLDPGLLRRYMSFLVDAKITWDCHVRVSLPVLTSIESARFLFEHLRGDVMPLSVVERFEQARNPAAFGIEFCAETINAIREIPGIGGVNLSTTGEPESIVAAVNQALA
jgi:methylenetetrahydrofolate reductase (NADPH)